MKKEFSDTFSKKFVIIGNIILFIISICLVLWLLGSFVYGIVTIPSDVNNNIFRHKDDITKTETYSLGKVKNMIYDETSFFNPYTLTVEQSDGTSIVKSVTKEKFQDYSIGDTYMETRKVLVSRTVTKKGSFKDQWRTIYYIVTESSIGNFFYVLSEENYNTLSLGDEIDDYFFKYVHKDHKYYDRIKNQ